jgi:hypothetical protein
LSQGNLYADVGSSAGPTADDASAIQKASAFLHAREADARARTVAGQRADWAEASSPITDDQANSVASSLDGDGDAPRARVLANI